MIINRRAKTKIKERCAWEDRSIKNRVKTGVRNCDNCLGQQHTEYVYKCKCIWK